MLLDKVVSVVAFAAELAADASMSVAATAAVNARREVFMFFFQSKIAVCSLSNLYATKFLLEKHVVNQ
jgi:hypothetical protein